MCVYIYVCDYLIGIVGARTNNGEGVSGISHHSRLMALKILDASGEGDVSHAIPAIQYAIDNGARVITNSWGGVSGQIIYINIHINIHKYTLIHLKTRKYTHIYMHMPVYPPFNTL